ncbi:superinfection immunity protein [uncultured Helicobacter sp.]|uniref:superinfection immunity protein n=1 Tax=uncultured Helicobacter sp. TaxID=175537 RepID=UPI001F993F63|nr:superinfection immunity protein [Candidatus Helicobacter avistercoris]
MESLLFSYVFFFVIILIFFFIFFLPTKIAYSKKSRNRGKIFLVNLFLGWTIISWFIILIWAINDKEEDFYV